MVNIIPANKPFYPTDHCGVLRIKTDDIIPKYMALALQVEGEFERFSRSNRASTQRIANLVGLDGTMDIDILHDNNSKLDYVIELNTRPSGTRYMTAATTNIYPLCQLVDMAKGHWSAKDVRNSMENYYSTELPIGNFPQENIPSQKRFSSENSYIVHGPKNYQRLTIRATSRNKLNNLTYELVSDYANANNVHFN